MPEDRRQPPRSRLAGIGAALILTALAAALPAYAAEPIKLHPQNPSYLQFRGKATILVGSSEHYGAVVNRDFDWRIYLETLAAERLNLTRLFVGSYYEKPGAFGIRANTLAPTPGRALLPWARSTTPGAADGGAKLDLARWDPEYFERLRTFVAEAGKRGIVVEVVLFSSYYDDGWPLSPLNAANNVNGIGMAPRHKANTLGNGELLAEQEKLVRKVVEELRDSDNVYYEIQNEPWADHEQPVDSSIPSMLPQDMAGSAWKNRVDLACRSRSPGRPASPGDGRDRGAARQAPPDRAEHLQPPLPGAGRGPARVDPQLPLRLAGGRDAEPGLRRIVAFDETGFANAARPRRGGDDGRSLSQAGLGVPDGGGRHLLHARLLVRRGPRGRGLRERRAGRRQPGAPAPASHPQGLPARLRHPRPGAAAEARRLRPRRLHACDRHAGRRRGSISGAAAEPRWCSICPRASGGASGPTP